MKKFMAMILMMAVVSEVSAGWLDILTGGGDSESENKKSKQKTQDEYKAIKLPEGTVIKCKLIRPVFKKGDYIAAFVVNDVVVKDRLLFPGGSEIMGQVKSVDQDTILADTFFILKYHKRQYRFNATLCQAKTDADGEIVGNFEEGVTGKTTKTQNGKQFFADTGTEFFVIN